MAVLKIIAASMLALASSGALYQYIGTKLDEQKYPPIGRMVESSCAKAPADKVGGYKLHMIDEGHNHNEPTAKPDDASPSKLEAKSQALGKITVIIEPGLAGNCLSASLITPEIAKFARVITYDRAGQGWSDASPLPRTAENIVQDLHNMLQNADIAGPYILVGHSFGGITVRLFAAKYPDEVAGVILVDASHENAFDQEKSSEKSMQNIVWQWYERSRWYIQHYFGIERYMTELNAHQHSNKPITNRSYRKTPKFVALKLSNKVMDAKISELDNFPLSCQQLKEANNGIKEKPLIVISAGKMRSSAVSTEKWANLQTDLATKSKFGKQIIADRSGHDIMTDQPEIIVRAVREMIKNLK